MRTSFIVACLLLLTSHDVRTQDSVAAARDLYAEANYEEALALLGRLESSQSQPTDRMAIYQYRAFCLLALGQRQDAERAIESILSVDLLFRPSDAMMSPRLRSAFSEVRQRMLPSIVQQEYTRAKAAFDRGNFASAIVQFERVLQAVDDPDLVLVASKPPLADLRTLAAGFRDLSIKAAAPPPAPVPAQPAAVVASAPPVRAIYTGAELGVSPPMTLRQVLPPFTLDGNARRGGILEVVIDENGAVESAAMKTRISPRYDQLAVAAAKEWKYTPATLNGRPVRYRKVINISITAAKKP
jgi:tetratricopeptide (TPR) repeat protein